MFQEKASWIVCDNMPFIHLMSCSREIEIQEELTRALIETQIAGLPEVAREEMLKKYGGLI